MLKKGLQWAGVKGRYETAAVYVYMKEGELWKTKKDAEKGFADSRCEEEMRVWTGIYIWRKEKFI